MNQTDVHKHACKEPPVFVAQDNPSPLVRAQRINCDPEGNNGSTPQTTIAPKTTTQTAITAGVTTTRGVAVSSAQAELTQIKSKTSPPLANLRDGRPGTHDPRCKLRLTFGEHRSRAGSSDGAHRF